MKIKEREVSPVDTVAHHFVQYGCGMADVSCEKAFI